MSGTWNYTGTAVTVEVTANSDKLSDKDVLRQSNLIASTVTDRGFTATLADSLCARVGCEPFFVLPLPLDTPPPSSSMGLRALRARAPPLKVALASQPYRFDPTPACPSPPARPS